MNFGMGLIYVPEHAAEDALLRPLRDERCGLISAPAPIPVEKDWRPLIDDLPRQWGTNTCVAQALSAAVEWSALAHGAPVAKPSVRWIYAQAQWKLNPRGKLINGGTSSRAAHLAAQEVGMIADARWPWDDARAASDPDAFVSEDLPFDADIAAVDAKLSSWYSADGDADTFEAVCHAIAQGWMVSISLNVYQNLAEGPGDLYDDVAGDFLGNHAMLAVAYKKGFGLCLANWWTKDWNGDGYVWISERFARSKFVLARTVVTAIPRTR